MIAVVYDRDEDYKNIGLYWLAGVPAVGDRIQILGMFNIVQQWEVVRVILFAKGTNFHPDGQAELGVNVVLCK